jgi:hypothetical protein
MMRRLNDRELVRPFSTFKSLASQVEITLILLRHGYDEADLLENRWQAKPIDAVKTLEQMRRDRVKR